MKPGVGSWQVYRPARALKDPVSGETLAYEAFHLGAAQVTADGSPATLRLTEAFQEVGRDDLLAPAGERILQLCAACSRGQGGGARGVNLRRVNRPAATT